jgi:hypothetical protein
MVTVVSENKLSKTNYMVTVNAKILKLSLFLFGTNQVEE